jgi:hypothetical protein
MMYELQSKITGRTHVVDEEVYDTLKANNTLKKYIVVKVHKPVKIVPEEIIQKRKINKSDSENES